jgi:transposase
MSTEREIGIGIDIGKHRHTVVLRAGDGRELTAPFLLDDSRPGVECLLEAVGHAEEQLGGRARVTVNMEATGVFHIPLFSALDPLYRVILWQPRQAKEATKKNIRRTKTDKRDCRTLALLHQNRQLTPPRTRYHDPLLVGAREVARVYYVLKDTRVNLSRRWTQEVFLANPGLDTAVDPSSRTGRRLLDVAPTPERLIERGATGIRPLLDGRGRRVRVTPEVILQVAQETLRAPAHEAAAALCQRSLRTVVDFLEERMAELEKELWAAWQLLRGETVIQTFPSMGWFRALVLHAEFGGLRRFPTADAAVSFAGLENYVYHSGHKRVDGGMTKAGSPLIRRVIWELLGCPATDLPRLTDYIGQKQRQGKHRSEALHAASKKLIRTLWAMDRDQRPYDSARAHATR